MFQQLGSHRFFLRDCAAPAILTLLFASLVAVQSVNAQAPVPRREYLAARTQLARLVLIESGPHSEADARAIVWTIYNRSRLRAGRTLLQVATAYCRPLRDGRARSPRQARIMSMHWGAMPRWLTTLLDSWAEGLIPDGCDADPYHWGAPALVGNDSRLLDCGRTHNAFLGANQDGD